MKIDQSKMLKLDLLDEILDSSAPAPTGNGVTEMALSQMQPFPEHKFKLYSGERLSDMVESIKEFGVLMPIILWHKDDDYLILSGHNRANAAKLAGLKSVPVMIKENLTHDEAVLIVTETNLRQRSFLDLSESEKAYSLAQHYEAMKSQGKRNDLLQEIENLMIDKTCAQLEHKSHNGSTSAQLEHKLNNREKLGQQYGLSRANVARYIRISSLTPELLQLLDNGKIAFLTAYSLSFISDSNLQKAIYNAVDCHGFKLDMKKAENLREEFEAGQLNESKIDLILSGALEQKRTKPKAIKIKPELADRYLSGKSQQEADEIIEKALTAYFGGAV